MGVKRFFVKKMLDKWEVQDKTLFANKLLPDGVCAYTNIPYIDDGHNGHLLDVYYPENTVEKLPIMIDLHGGGFMCGSKEMNKLYGYYLAKRGFVVFNINYRLAFSDTKVLDQIRDVHAAAKWIKDNICRYPADVSQTYISGHSAGGVLALLETLLAKSSRMQNLFGIDSEQLEYKGVVLDCGMMSFYKNSLGYWGMRSICFEKGYKRQSYYQNMLWARVPEIGQLPPVYLISNKKDELKNMTLAFEKILKRNGIIYQLNFAQRCSGKALGHMAIIYNPDDGECSGVIDDMLTFFASKRTS